MSSNDLYNVSKYTDKELYDILDISNPTDRELEAHILSLIRKYSNIANEDGERLRKFFEDIYDHFFDDDTNDNDDNADDETMDENTIVETLENMPTQGPTPSAKKETPLDPKTTTQLVTTIDNVPDSLRLNPLLKQTIKRVICIDSQYRDVKTYPNTNNFSYDLSEPLRDVISLKMFSIQIPYTWYTISKNYGANFFYLKAVTPGIDNGQHDYQVIIPVGNYDTNTSIIAAVNKSFYDISNANPDTNFDKTGITYDATKCISTFNLNIQKVYTETSYYLEFPNWSSSILPDTQTRSNTIASYFGYNNTTYYPHTILSNQNYKTTAFINNDTKKSFSFDNSNNYFTVVHYIGPDDYNTQFSTVVNTYKITLYDTIYNTRLPVGQDTSYNFTRNEVLSMTNTAIQKSGYFTTTSGITQYDISNNYDVSYGNVYNAGNTCYKLTLMFNRYAVKYNVNSRIAVIFPQEIASSYGSNTVWTLQQGVANCCFYFDNLTNVFGKFTTEVPSVQSSYNVPVNINAYMYFRCISPSWASVYPYPTDASNNPVATLNDFIVNIPKGNYTLNQFVQQMNNSMITSDKKGATFGSDTLFSIQNSYLNSVIDLSKTFKENNYRISFDMNSVLCKYLGLTPVNYAKLSSVNIFNSTFPIQYGGYNVSDTPYIMTIYPDVSGNGGNIYEPNHVLTLSTTTFYSYSDLIRNIQNTINSFEIINTVNGDIQTPFSQTSLVTTDDGVNANLQFTVKINYTLTEGNYQLEFYPSDMESADNPWHRFGIDPSYNLHLLTKDPSGGVDFPYAKFKGTLSVSQNQITVVDGKNTINIRPYYDASGGAYDINKTSDENMIVLTITPGTYTITDLYTQINAQFNAAASNNSGLSLYGSTIGATLINNIEYTTMKLVINRVYTTADYKLSFYDPFSFVSCSAGTQGVQSTTWDTTLGWILGFRDYTEYVLSKSNQNTNADTGVSYYLNSRTGVYTYTQSIDTNSQLTMSTTVNLSADTTLTTTLYTYFVISLNDYNQNHINDGLVTITRAQTSIQMPDYSSTSTQICDPVTGKLVNRSIPQANTDNLTAKQVYAINQSNVSRSSKTKTYSPGPFVKDLFAYIPIKPGSTGTYFVDSGGALQTQERLYFGPVNIRKMSVQLMTDRGDMLDLNGSNWSFSFVCEQLYRSSSSTSK